MGRRVESGAGPGGPVWEGVGDKGALSVLEGMGGRESQAFISSDLASPWPQARSWALSHGKGREARRGFWEILVVVRAQPQKLVDGNKPNVRMPPSDGLGDHRAAPPRMQSP